MEVKVASGSPAEQRADWLVLPLTEQDPAAPKLPARTAALDRALEGRIGAVLGTGDFRGRRGETLALYPDDDVPFRRLLLLGIGPAADVDAAALREAAAGAVRAAEARGGGRLVLVAPSGPAARRVRTREAAGALAEGLVLASYRFDRYRTRRNDDAPKPVEAATVLIERSSDLRAARAAATTGVALAESQNLARDLSNEPPNVLTPAALARETERMAKEVGLRCRVIDPPGLRRLGLGAMLAVAGGSSNTPRLVVLEHDPAGARAPRRKKAGRKKAARKTSRRHRTICLVGKGVCFDSGGLSLKPALSMVKMKHDMSGAAAVVGALRAAALLGVPHRVVGIVGAVENLPSATAYRPDDILTSGSGQTIEITNTDAEGRLVLADALHYARSEFEPDAIVDLATLTGACGIALGSWAAAVLGNHEGLSDAIRSAGEAAGERFWPLPLWDVHREHMRSKIADVRQTGGREGGTITAAAFLAHFAGDQPWAHLDIASVAESENETPLGRPGATGFGVRTLAGLLQSFGDLRL